MEVGEEVILDEATAIVKIMVENVPKERPSRGPYHKPGQQKPEVAYAKHRQKKTLQEQIEEAARQEEPLSPLSSFNSDCDPEICYSSADNYGDGDALPGTSSASPPPPSPAQLQSELVSHYTCRLFLLVY